MPNMMVEKLQMIATIPVEGKFQSVMIVDEITVACHGNPDVFSWRCERRCVT